MAQNANAASIVKNLIETCRDGELGFREAAERLTDPSLRDFFLEKSRERASFASELQTALSGLGEYKEQAGSIAGAVHRAWIDFKSAVGMKDDGILAAAETGEDSAKKTYEDATRENLPPQISSIVQRQLESVRIAHDRVKQLRDQRKAA